MKAKKRIKIIVDWIKTYAEKHHVESLVVGVSGGIDSAVVSTLCAHTGISTIAVSMPILQSQHTHNLSLKHGEWLNNNFDNVVHYTLDLTPTFKQFETDTLLFNNELAYANSRSRLRMMTLYQIAQSKSGIVVGTGNRVEDFGVGFFTKYGDGGVDIGPIADCLKTEVWDMGRELGVVCEIIEAEPTDGLWADGRTDRDQIGMDYADLERMMDLDKLSKKKIRQSVSESDQEKLQQFRQLQRRNLHKMRPIPVCRFDK